MISKELCIAIGLGQGLDEIYTEDHLGNKYKEEFILRYGKGVVEISIYLLAYKCKEWAIEYDCQLLSCLKSKDRAICDIYSNKYNCKFTHYAETEPEAIFKACEWILEQKEEK